MRKAINLFIILTLCSTALFGCGGKDNPAGKREIFPPGTSPTTARKASPDASPSQIIDKSNTSVPEKGTIASLDELKKKTLAAGYKTAELFEVQKQMTENLAGGFNIVIGSSNISVLEFATPKDAQVYADMINTAGYGVAIINGRFLTSVEATKGVIKNDKLQKELESIMEAKAQVKDNWSNAENVPTKTTDYKSAYSLMDNINKSMNTLLDQSLTKNNKAHPVGDPKNTESVIPNMFGSVSISFTSGFCEDEAQCNAIISSAEMLGMSKVKVRRNAAHDYTLSATKRSKNLPYEIHSIYDPAAGSLRMVEKTDGKITEFFEFIPLGGDQYAFNTNKERAIVTYKGKLMSFIYTKINKNDKDYSLESNSIYPTGKNTNNKWVTERGEDGYAEYYDFNGSMIKLNVKTFNGRIKTELPL